MATRRPKTRLVLGKQDEGRLVTADEFASAVFDEPWTYERVRGRLVVMSPEGKRHVRTSSPWWTRLILYKHEHPGVVDEVVPQPWVRIDADNDRIGDVGVYLFHEGRDLDIPDQPPDLMFEIVSPGGRKRDYVEKRADYHRAGIREYVVIDRGKKVVTVLTHAPDGYREQVLTVADTYRTPLLPGFEVVLAEVL